MRARDSLLLLLALVLALALGACGDEGNGAEDGGGAEPDWPADMPREPVEALEWVRAAEFKPGGVELARRIALWPETHEDFRETEETQLVVTWRIRLALQAGDVEAAYTHWHVLLDQFAGHGVAPEGRGLMPDMVRLGIFEEARLQARRRIEGPKPDRKRAEEALTIGASLLTDVDGEDRTRLDWTRRWVELAHPRNLKISSYVQGWDGPQVYVYADHFALGEPLLVDVLQRWQDQGKDARLRVFVYPLLRGQIRVGRRRVPAESMEAEYRAIEKDLKARKLGIGWRGPGPGLNPEDWRQYYRRAANNERDMGLEGQDVMIVVADRKDRVVGKLSGEGVDARELDPVIEKLISR